MFVVDAEGVIRWSLAVSAGLGPRADARLAGLDSLRSMSSLRLRSGGLSRRLFLAATLAAAFALALPLGTDRAETQAAEMVSSGMTATPPVGTMPVTLTVNGTGHPLTIDPRVTLLDALRERIGLTGSKKGCDHE